VGGRKKVRVMVGEALGRGGKMGGAGGARWSGGGYDSMRRRKVGRERGERSGGRGGWGGDRGI